MSVFASSEELETIQRFHPIGEATEILNATLSDLIDVVAYRYFVFSSLLVIHNYLSSGDGTKSLQLSARQLNTFMRETYSNFIHQVGRSIYPFILASDYEPGFEGVGSTFTLFLRDGRCST